MDDIPAGFKVVGAAPPANDLPPGSSVVSTPAAETVPLPRPKPPVERSLTDTIMGVADQGVRGAATGLVKMVTAPIELAEFTRQLTEGTHKRAGLPDALAKLTSTMMHPMSAGRPFLGADAVTGYLDKANAGIANLFGTEAPRTEPRSTTERVVNRVGEEVGAAALPIGGATAAGARLGVDGARKLPLLARMFVEPAAVDAGKFAGKEAATAAAAGTGAGLVNEATHAAGIEKDSWKHAAGDIGGALGGAGVLGAARTVGPMVGDVFNAIFRRGNFSNQQVKSQVTDVLANSADTLPKTEKAPIDTQPLVDTIMGNPKVSDTIPGFKESLADRTRDPGIASTEYSRQTGPNGGMFTQQRNANTGAVDQALDASAPRGTPGAFRSELETERTRQIEGARGHTADAQANLDQHLQRLQPAMTGEGRGANIRTALEGASERAREIVDAAWAPLNQSGHRVDMAPLAEDFGRVSNNMSTAERERFRPREADIPERLSGREDGPPLSANDNGGVAPPQGEAITQPINEVTGLRSALTDAAREARTNGRNNEARIINQHVEALDSYLETAVPEALREEYTRARAATFDMNERFTRPQTAIAQTLDRREGMYRQPDSAVAAKFVQADEGRIADFQSLMRETGNDQGVIGAVRDQILADVRDRGLLNNPQQLDEYLTRYNTVLSDPRFANVRQELTTAGGLRGALDSTIGAERNLTSRLGTPDSPGTGPVGQYLRYGDEKSTQAMKGVLASKDPAVAADELLTFVRDQPAAVEGARRTFWDIMQQTARRGGETTATVDGAQPWMPKALNGFLTDPANRAVAERLYRDNPEHLANINRISDALQGVDLRSRAKAPNTSGTAQGVNNVLTPETIQSRFYAYKRGQTSFGFMVTALASVAARRAVKGAQGEAVEKLLDRALLDPELAATLLKENNPANRAALARTSKAFLGNEAATLVDAINDDHGGDPVKSAVMKKDERP